MTKQGLRDLNDYGPRRGRGLAGAPVATTVAKAQIAPKAGPPLTSSIGRHDEHAVNPMTPSSALVIGCSDQRPNELRAYNLMGTSTEGALLLSRHGATYSGVASEVTGYSELLECMLGLVLAGCPVHLRERARPELIARWNRDWGVDAEDLVGIDPVAPANDNGSTLVTESSVTSPSPVEVSQPTIEDHGSIITQAALDRRAQAAANG